MLFIFDKLNSIQIAWHSQTPSQTSGNNGQTGYPRFIRTRSAG